MFYVGGILYVARSALLVLLLDGGIVPFSRIVGEDNAIVRTGWIAGCGETRRFVNNGFGERTCFVREQNKRHGDST